MESRRHMNADMSRKYFINIKSGGVDILGDETAAMN
jgi:hypothetical protein